MLDPAQSESLFLGENRLELNKLDGTADVISHGSTYVTLLFTTSILCVLATQSESNVILPPFTCSPPSGSQPRTRFVCLSTSNCS